MLFVNMSWAISTISKKDLKRMQRLHPPTHFSPWREYCRIQLNIMNRAWCNDDLQSDEPQLETLEKVTGIKLPICFDHIIIKETWNNGGNNTLCNEILFSNLHN